MVHMHVRYALDDSFMSSRWAGSSSSITRSDSMQSLNPLVNRRKSSIPCQSTVIEPTLAVLPYCTSRNSANLRAFLSPCPIILLQSVQSLFRVYFDGTERDPSNRPFRKFVGGTGRLNARSKEIPIIWSCFVYMIVSKEGRMRASSLA
jgi:hypothetical protein